jgi:hypothetical protein
LYTDCDPYPLLNILPVTLVQLQVRKLTRRIRGGSL